MDWPITSYSERLERASPQIVAVSTKIKTSDPGYSSSGVLAGTLRLINPLSPASGPATSSFNDLQTKSNFLAIQKPIPSNIPAERGALASHQLPNPKNRSKNKIAAKIILPKRSGKLCSRLLRITLRSIESPTRHLEYSPHFIISAFLISTLPKSPFFPPPLRPLDLSVAFTPKAIS